MALLTKTDIAHIANFMAKANQEKRELIAKQLPKLTMDEIFAITREYMAIWESLPEKERGE